MGTYHHVNLPGMQSYSLHPSHAPFLPSIPTAAPRRPHPPRVTGALICLAFVHNILRRHQACLVLLDRPTPEGDDAPQSGSDPYLDSQEDPAKSRAIESSLWEVQSLCRHYYTQVCSTPPPLAPPHTSPHFCEHALS